jgi:hypothetical protein
MSLFKKIKIQGRFIIQNLHPSVKNDIEVDEDGGTSITSVILGINIPHGVLLADFPDVLGAMAT